MDLTNELARRLASQADSVNQSLDEVAASLLSGLLKQLPESTEGEPWTISNARRLKLIQKSMESDLSSDEHAELQSLQEELYRRLEDSDISLEKMRSDLKSLVN